MAQLSYARLEPMFRDRSLNRADIATDLAIPLMAERGWAGLTMAAVAQQGNMRRQSVAQWFGSVDALREQVAWRYAHRWQCLLSAHLAPLYGAAAPDAGTVARLLLPQDEDGIAFGEAQQLTMVVDWLPNAKPSERRAVCALVTGLRAQMCAPEPISLADACAATEVFRDSEDLRR